MNPAPEVILLAAWCTAFAVILQGCGRHEPRIHEVRTTTSPAPPPRSDCSEINQDCRSTRCCTDAGYMCYEKNDYWAACRPTCSPGPYELDPLPFRTNWSCTLLVPVREESTNCSDDGFSCKTSNCCEGLSCYEKDATWAGCKRVCTAGVDPRDPPDLQTPWTCKLLGSSSTGDEAVQPTRGSELQVQLPSPAVTNTKVAHTSVEDIPLTPPPVAMQPITQTVATSTSFPPEPQPQPVPLPSTIESSRFQTASPTSPPRPPCNTSHGAEGALHVSGVQGETFVQGDGGLVSSGVLTMHHNSGYSIMTSCKSKWAPDEFAQFKLVGRSLSFTVDLSQVGCACNLAFYLVSSPALGETGLPSDGQCDASPYYCDANRVCGQFCPEIDIMEANNHVFQSTPHRCDPPNGLGHYSSCDRNGCSENTRDMPNAYGPGGAFTIDTTRPFVVSTAFNGQGSTLTGMITTLKQEGRQVVLSHAACDPNYLAQVGAAMEPGMSLRITYWGDDAETMNWMDMPPCGQEACSGVNAGDGIISEIVVDPPQVDSLVRPVPAAAPAPRPAPLPAAPQPPQLPAAAAPAVVGPPASPTSPGQPPQPQLPQEAPPVAGPSEDCSPAWHQCGGQGWAGPSCCTSDSHCVHYNEWFWQCVAKPSPTPAPTPAPLPSPSPPAPGARLPLADRMRIDSALHQGQLQPQAQPESEHEGFLLSSHPASTSVSSQPPSKFLLLAIACFRNTLLLGLLCLVLYVLAVLVLWAFPSLAPAMEKDGSCEWASLLPLPPDCMTRLGASACRLGASAASMLGLASCQRACEITEGGVRQRVEEVSAAVRKVNRIIRFPIDWCWKVKLSRQHFSSST